MHTLYNLGIRCYGIVLHLAALFSDKARLWIYGRKEWRVRYQGLRDLKEGFWFHCASLGEFEQGRPLMEELKLAHPNVPLLITFFSPSGYTIRKDYELADWVGYLPLDTPDNARYFVELIAPKQAFFVKYEFWANYLVELKKKDIPTYCVSGLFRPDQRFFKVSGGFFREVLGCFDQLFVQNIQSAELLSSIGLDNVIVSGDTRYDRVVQNARQPISNEVIKKFVADERAFVIGSCWPVDEDVVFSFIQSGQIGGKVVIAPHEINEAHITAIEQRFNIPALRLTKCTMDTDFEHVRILILDCIGQLANAYRFGSFAYVGGAFGKGLHNILEPAVFGLPVIFGPNYAKFPEAKAFIDEGIGFSVSNKEEFSVALDHITVNLAVLSVKATSFIVSNSGATATILNALNEKSTQ